MVSGLTNDLVSTDTEGAFDLTGASLDFDNNGLDPEALVKLSDGTFGFLKSMGRPLCMLVQRVKSSSA